VCRYYWDFPRLCLCSRLSLKPTRGKRACSVCSFACVLILLRYVWSKRMCLSRYSKCDGADSSFPGACVVCCGCLPRVGCYGRAGDTGRRGTVTPSHTRRQPGLGIISHRKTARCQLQWQNPTPATRGQQITTHCFLPEVFSRSTFGNGHCHHWDKQFTL